MTGRIIQFPAPATFKHSAAPAVDVAAEWDQARRINAITARLIAGGRLVSWAADVCRNPFPCDCQPGERKPAGVINLWGADRERHRPFRAGGDPPPTKPPTFPCKPPANDPPRRRPKPPREDAP
jgi:hypothetical protein